MSSLLVSILNQSVELFKQSENEDNWQTFDSSLAKLKSSIGSKSDALLVIKTIRSQLVQHLLSERSRLSGTAMECLGVVARSLAPDFDAHFDHFIPALMKLLNRPNKVFSTRAELCLLDCLKANSATMKQCLKLFEYNSAQSSKTVRIAIVKCFAECVATLKDNDSLYCDKVQKYLSIALQDPAIEVREIARKAFQTCLALNEAKSMGVLNTLPAHVQKYLNAKPMTAPAITTARKTAPANPTAESTPKASVSSRLAAPTFASTAVPSKTAIPPIARTSSARSLPPLQPLKTATATTTTAPGDRSAKIGLIASRAISQRAVAMLKEMKDNPSIASRASSRAASKVATPRKPPVPPASTSTATPKKPIANVDPTNAKSKLESARKPAVKSEPTPKKTIVKVNPSPKKSQDKVEVSPKKILSKVETNEPKKITSILKSPVKSESKVISSIKVESPRKLLERGSSVVGSPKKFEAEVAIAVADTTNPFIDTPVKSPVKDEIIPRVDLDTVDLQRIDLNSLAKEALTSRVESLSISALESSSPIPATKVPDLHLNKSFPVEEVAVVVDSILPLVAVNVNADHLVQKSEAVEVNTFQGSLMEDVKVNDADLNLPELENLSDDQFVDVEEESTDENLVATTLEGSILQVESAVQMIALTDSAEVKAVDMAATETAVIEAIPSVQSTESKAGDLLAKIEETIEQSDLQVPSNVDTSSKAFLDSLEDLRQEIVLDTDKIQLAEPSATAVLPASSAQFEAIWNLLSGSSSQELKKSVEIEVSEISMNSETEESRHSAVRQSLHENPFTTPQDVETVQLDDEVVLSKRTGEIVTAMPHPDVSADDLIDMNSIDATPKNACNISASFDAEETPKNTLQVQRTKDVLADVQQNRAITPDSFGEFTTAATLPALDSKSSDLVLPPVNRIPSKEMIFDNLVDKFTGFAMKSPVKSSANIIQQVRVLSKPSSPVKQERPASKNEVPVEAIENRYTQLNSEEELDFEEDDFLSMDEMAALEDFETLLDRKSDLKNDPFILEKIEKYINASSENEDSDSDDSCEDISEMPSEIANNLFDFTVDPDYLNVQSTAKSIRAFDRLIDEKKSEIPMFPLDLNDTGGSPTKRLSANTVDLYTSLIGNSNEDF